MISVTLKNDNSNDEKVRIREQRTLEKVNKNKLILFTFLFTPIYDFNFLL